MKHIGTNAHFLMTVNAQIDGCRELRNAFASSRDPVAVASMVFVLFHACRERRRSRPKPVAPKLT